ncbi:hypothetical protein C8A03DRAFT_18872, partial [Achaetomium macrosporum]
VDPAAKDSSGRTALHRAVSNGDLPLADMLLNTWRLDPNEANDDGNTPLHDLAAERVYFSFSHLHASWIFGAGFPAVRDKVKPVCHLLREAGADPERRNAAGKTPRAVLMTWKDIPWGATFEDLLYRALKEVLETM